MKVSTQLKGGIYEISFRYNTKLGGYTTLVPDIPKLYAMPLHYLIGLREDGCN